MNRQVGNTGLSISVVINGIDLLKFIRDWVDDSKQYGEDVRSFKTRLSTEIARLEALSGFLSQTADEGQSRLEQLSITFQRAAKGMIQELQIKLASYTPLIAKYSMKDLQRGFESSSPSDLDGLSIEDTTRLKEAGDKDAKERQEKIPPFEMAAWGLFRKKKISKLLSDITKWNDQLQSLLLCSLLFGNGPEVATITPPKIWNDLRLSNGITLQKMIAESTQPTSELFHPSWVLKPSDIVKGSGLETRLQDLVTDGSTETVFVECKSFEVRRCTNGPSDLAMSRLKNLVKLLSQPNATQSGFNTLQCIGVIEQDMPSQRIATKQFTIIFRLPLLCPETNLTPAYIPISLQTAITSTTERRPTLGERFQLAHTLAQTVFQLHSVNWLHKSIRSENVLLPRNASKITYAAPYLVGFEFSRVENERSTTERDDILDRDIYRHPNRQGQPEDRFMILHDIYALGVTLLEIGIWRPVVGFDRHFVDMTPERIKACLEMHAQERLPHYMGDAYTAAVLHCLQGTLVESVGEGPGFDGLGDLAQREQVQVAFLEKVIGGIECGTALL